MATNIKLASVGEITSMENALIRILADVDAIRAKLGQEIHPAPGGALRADHRDYWKTLALNARPLVESLQSIIDAIDAH